MAQFINSVKNGFTEFFQFLQERAFDIKYDLRDTAYRGFGVPKLISDVAGTAVLGVAAVGSLSLGLEVASKFVCKSKCKTCNGWEALRCTMCGGTGKVQYRVKNCGLKDGEEPTRPNVAAAIADGRAEVVHFPASFDLELPLPTKECPTCSGSGVMKCTECKDNLLNLRISVDNLLDVPWKTWDVQRKLDVPYENILAKIQDPTMAAFWLIARPELEGGFKFDEDVKQKLWWKYKEFMRYDTARKVVANREPGWEHMQEVLFAIDPISAREDPIVVKNIPYYKAKKKLEAEIMQLEVPPRPSDWGSIELPLKETYWAEKELKDPRIQFERSTLLVAQQHLVERYLDTAWEIKWRKQKFDEVLEERVRPYIEKLNDGVDPEQLVSRKSSKEGAKSSKVESQKDLDKKQLEEAKKRKKQEEAEKKRKEKQESNLAKQTAQRKR
eukprot:Gb_18684 [translate_table: standard]